MTTNNLNRRKYFFPQSKTISNQINCSIDEGIVVSGLFVETFGITFEIKKTNFTNLRS